MLQRMPLPGLAYGVDVAALAGGSSALFLALRSPDGGSTLRWLASSLEDQPSPAAVVSEGGAVEVAAGAAGSAALAGAHLLSAHASSVVGGGNPSVPAVQVFLAEVSSLAMQSHATPACPPCRSF